MVICEVCKRVAKYQYVNIEGHAVCLDCANTKTVDDMMVELGLQYEDVPEELEVEFTVEEKPYCEDMTSPDDSSFTVQQDSDSSYPGRI